MDIDDDLLAAAKEIARREHSSAGQVVSRLLRSALTGASPAAMKQSDPVIAVGGFRPFASRGKPVTNEHIDRLRDDEGI
jgi:hypothetical protein